MALDDETKEKIEMVVKPIATSVLATVAVAAVTAVVKKLVVTNYKNKNLTGDVEMKPTEKEVAINKTETNASTIEGKGMENEVTGEKGGVNANENNANALENAADAADTKATAAQSKAGALQTKAKALDIS